MKVIVEDSAIADIDGLTAWIGKDNPQAAKAMVGRVFEVIERLNLFPELEHAGRDEGTYERTV